MEEKDPLDPQGEDLGEGAAGRGFVADAVRKAILAGVGAVFMTEEGARRLAREWKLPKELLGFVVGQAQGAKDEILRVLSDELRRLFDSPVFRRELLKVLSSLALEVKAEIRFKERDGAIEPDVNATAAARSVRPEPSGGDDDGEPPAV